MVKCGRHLKACPAKSASWRRSGSLPREAFRRSGGFSLIELLIVTSIISLAFIGILALIQRAIKIYYSNQNALVASVLAQEGLELVYYLRDDNWLTSKSFSQNLSQGQSDSLRTILALDHQATAGEEGRTKIVQFYNSAEGDKLSGLDGSGDLDTYLQDERAGLYTDSASHNFYSIWTATNPPAAYSRTLFNRLIQVVYYNNDTTDTADDYFYIISKIYWQDRGQPKYYSVSGYLYDYSQRY